MKKLIILSFVLGSSLVGYAQQRDQSSFDHVNRFNLNNATAGLDSCIHVFGQRKQQWIGVDGAPITNQLQGHMPIGTDMGVGLEVSNWSAGLLNSTNIAGTFAKHFDLSDNKYRLSAALSLGYYQYSFGSDNAVAFDNDPYLDQSSVTAGGIYGDLGVLLTAATWEAGISVPSLFSTAPELELGNEVNEYNVEPYFNFHGMYHYTLNSDMVISPMAILRTMPGNGAIFDLKAGLNYQNLVGVNLGYRTNSGLLFAADFTWNDMVKIGYAYDAGFTEFSGISRGSHEFLLGFQICKPKRQPKEPEPVDYFLRGQVSEAGSGQPMEGIAVIIKNLGDSTSKTVRSDSNGFYVVKVDSSQKYEISALTPDHEKAMETTTINPAMTEQDLNLSMVHKQVAAEGQVRDAETGAPIQGVDVTLAQGDEVYTAKTNPDGRFSFPLKDKKRGDQLNYTLTLKKSGYDPYEKNFAKELADYKTINLDSEIDGGLKMKKEKKPEKISEIIELNPINFEVNSAKLTQESEVELDKVVKVLTDNPEMKIEVGAHTDCTGSESGNQRLSQKRAESSMEYIRSKIENPERVTGQGYGESQPVTECECGDCSKEDHAKNRRTEFKIVRD